MTNNGKSQLLLQSQFRLEKDAKYHQRQFLSKIQNRITEKTENKEF